MTLGDHEHAASWKINALGPIASHDENLHVAVHDVKQLVSVRMHLPARRPGGAIEATSTKRMSVQATQLNILKEWESVEDFPDVARTHSSDSSQPLSVGLGGREG